MPDAQRDPLLDVPVDPDAREDLVDEAFLDRIYDGQRHLEHLRNHPLLGPDRHAATERIRAVAAVLQEIPDDLASADLFRLAGDLSLEAGHGEAVDRYLRGAAAARRKGDFRCERDLHLRACRAVARMRGAESARGFFQELGKRDPEPCPITFALTCADIDPSTARENLEEALQLLTDPARAHERLMALEDLAEAYLAGKEPSRAIDVLKQALKLAEQWADQGRAGHAHALMATIHLTTGRPEASLPHLEAAFAGAIEEDDDLLTVVHGTVLCGLYLDRERWSDAEPVARRILASAERRGNWIGVADAALAWSATFVGQDRASAAVAVVGRTLLTLRQQNAHAAAALLHARLGELRAVMGDEAFDLVLRRVLAALGSAT
ncbi:MAG: hypothetical protein CL927_18565 [Deltaproteobacteria bacterium]|nr:hypothetical protein [Deltaproteobacteria bacterium]HCH62577.1 hypothetical protein [Deltaproteobacteria bacterium]